MIVALDMAYKLWIITWNGSDFWLTTHDKDSSLLLNVTLRFDFKIIIKCKILNLSMLIDHEN